MFWNLFKNQKKQKNIIFFYDDWYEILSQTNDFEKILINQDKFFLEKDKIKRINWLKEVWSQNNINPKKNKTIIFLSTKNYKILKPEIFILSGLKNFQIYLWKNYFEDKLPIFNEKKILIHWDENQKIIIYYLNQEKLCQKQNLNSISEIDFEKIKNFSEKNLVYISGYFDNFKEIEKFFYQHQIKTKLWNIWEDIIDFEKKIPPIDLIKTHQHFNLINYYRPKTEIILDKECRDEEKEKEKDLIHLINKIKAKEEKRKKLKKKESNFKEKKKEKIEEKIIEEKKVFDFKIFLKKIWKKIKNWFIKEPQKPILPSPQKIFLPPAHHLPKPKKKLKKPKGLFLKKKKDKKK